MTVRHLFRSTVTAALVLAAFGDPCGGRTSSDQADPCSGGLRVGLRQRRH